MLLSDQYLSHFLVSMFEATMLNTHVASILPGCPPVGDSISALDIPRATRTTPSWLWHSCCYTAVFAVKIPQVAVWNSLYIYTHTRALRKQYDFSLVWKQCLVYPSLSPRTGYGWQLIQSFPSKLHAIARYVPLRSRRKNGTTYYSTAEK